MGELQFFSFFSAAVLMLFRQILEEYGVRLNVLGKTSLLPEYVQEAVRHVESVTRNNNK
jgi:undecaprenyl pyrophosphate synthase